MSQSSNDSISRRWKAVVLSAFWCGAGQFYKGEYLKGFLMLPVNLLFYPMTLFALISIGDYEHPGAAARVFPIYIKVLCIAGPIWAWGLVDSFRPPRKEGISNTKKVVAPE